MKSKVSFGTAQAGSSPRFCICKLWRVQDIPDACRTCSAIHFIAILLFQERRKAKNKFKKKGKMAF
jgi:hypothetical protein